MAGGLPGGHGPNLPTEFVVPKPAFADSPAVPPGICAFVSNAAAPQIVNYALAAGLGFFVASAITPQGQANAAEYTFGTHAVAIHQAEGAKSRVWGSARAALSTAPLSFVWAAPQFDPSLPSVVWKSQVVGNTPRLIPSVFAGPQLADLTQQAYFEAPTPARQGAVPPLTTGAPQTDPSQIAPLIWRSQPATITPVATFYSTQPQADPTQIAAQVWKSQFSTLSAIAPFFSIPPQTEDRQTRAIWQSLVAGQTPPVIPRVWAAPQQVDLTQQALFIKPGRPTGAVPPATSAAPQTDPSQLQAQIWQSVVTPPAIAGVTVWPAIITPPQFDTSVNPSAFWTPSTFSPGGPPPAPTTILDSGVKHHRPLVIRAKDFEKREDLAAFLKAQIKLRTPTAVEEIPNTAEALAASDIPGVPVLSVDETAKLLSDEKRRTTAINNQLLALILSLYDDDDT